MKRILMATDGSKHAEKTLNETIKLASALNAEVTIITVMEDPPSLAYMVPSDFFTQAKESHAKLSKEILEKAEQKLKEKGIETKILLKSGHPGEVICKVANEGNYDLVIIGSRGLNALEEFLLGSVSNRVAHCAKTSVYIVK